MDTEIGPLLQNSEDNTIIDLSTTTKHQISKRVDVDNGPISSNNIDGISLQMKVDGVEIQVENNAPYALGGNSGSDYYAVNNW